MSGSPASGYSNNGLISLHLSVLNALKADDETPSDQPKLYEVRQHRDWRTWGDALEAELTERKIPFTPIPW